MQQQLKCNLHNLEFSLYCDRCMQLICHKCTIIGPHNTAIHSVCRLNQAYERRVQQIDTRLNKLLQHRDKILIEINYLGYLIESYKANKKCIDSENEKYQSKMQINLKKAYENIINSINKGQEQYHQQLSGINDLGHHFQTLQSSIQVVANYKNIMSEFKQIIDKTQIILNWKSSDSEQLPKELTDLRIKLKQIDSLDEIYHKKKQTIKQLIIKLEKAIKKIQAPEINYQEFLEQLNRLMNKYKGKGCVCYFCSLIMTQNTINTFCEKNKTNQQIFGIGKERGASSIATLEGYGDIKPDISKFGTHRHYFGAPADPNYYYFIVFIDELASKIPEEKQYQKTQLYDLLARNYAINKGLSGKNTFSYYLQALFLKTKTLAKLKSKSLNLLFSKQDTDKDGTCDKITLNYVLVQLIKLQLQQADIIASAIQTPKGQGYDYTLLLTKLQQIFI